MRTLRNQFRLDFYSGSVSFQNPEVRFGPFASPGPVPGKNIAKHPTTQFIRVSANVSRIGVMPYRQAGNPKPRMELKLPEELFGERALSTFDSLPVTREHPSEIFVTKGNYKKFLIGLTENCATKKDGFYLTSALTIFDATMIAEIYEKACTGIVQDVSCGYYADVDETPGIWNGLKYDAVQRNIRFNHVAIVKEGRGGSSVSIILNSKDAPEGAGISCAREQTH